ncbi:MAG: 50S ribosomal protein L4, partial [Clostridiales bacterium]|nr:50S ribosomal protein L4 [Clostridiales bacterium]
MPKVEVFNTEGKAVGEIELDENIFGVKINEALLHQVVRMQLNNKRQGTQSALTRAEVRGGGAKPWRQKGTGRARHGSIRSPIWVKGGVAFAPKPRDYSFKVTRKMRRLALKSALTSKAAGKEILVLDSLELSQPKTKEMVKVLKNLEVQGKALVVLPERNETLSRAAGNLQEVKLASVNTLNVLDILNYDKFIITK